MRKLFAKAQDPISCETHALGAVAALGGGLLYLLRGVWTDAAIPAVAAALCFCLSMAALYAASAIYHYYPGTAASGGVKRVLRKMDHSMIYVLIAGSYTPFCVVLLPQPRGTQFCLILWGVALAGGAGEDAVDQRTTDAVHGSISHHGMVCGVCGKGLHRSGPALPDAGGSGRDLLLGGSGVLRRQEAQHLGGVDLPRTVPPVDSGGVFLPLSGGISVCAVTQWRKI